MMQLFQSRIVIGVALASAMLMSAWPCDAQKVLHNFTGTDGSNPYENLLSVASGTLYGTTPAGGTGCAGCGTVFALAPPAQGKHQWTFTTLYNFGGGADGGDPTGGLIADSTGALYGTTGTGGTGSCAPNGCGTVFELVPPAQGSTQWTKVILYNFAPAPDGNLPFAGLVADASGSLYGTASAGGAFGRGAVFKLAPPVQGQTAWTESVIYSFGDGSDGQAPYAALTFDANGNLYGTTSGLPSTRAGTVFELTPHHNGWTEKVLASFSSKNQLRGWTPYTGVTIGPSGTVYGTTSDGGGKYFLGNVFELTPPQDGVGRWKETVIHHFSDLAGPTGGSLVADASGVLYGTAFGGGLNRFGGVYQLTPPAQGETRWRYKVLISFNGTDGGGPQAGLIFGNGGNLYGTTAFGGTTNNGVIFSLKP